MSYPAGRLESSERCFSVPPHRNAAVAEIGRFRLRGFLAWVVWLVVHLMRLVGFRNRLVVLIYWAWDYLFYDRAVRVIMPDARWPWTAPDDR